MNKQQKHQNFCIDTLFFGEIKTFDTKTFVVPNLDAKKKTIKKNCVSLHSLLSLLLLLSLLMC